jgi:predicted lipoprotein with Yx(FWY)xxD motif
LLAEGEVTVGAGLDASLFTTVARTDGTMQVKVGDWPLYYFAADQAAGETNGQGVGDVWYVVSPTGEQVE